CVAAEGAMHADRWRAPQIPFALINFGERLVIKHAGRADFREVAAELIFEDAILVPAEIDMIVSPEDIEITTSSVLAIKADTAIAGDAPVHLMGHEWPQILVPEGALLEAITTISMPSHHGHILKMALASLLADRAVMRMNGHQPLDHAGAELHCLGIAD